MGECLGVWMRHVHPLSRLRRAGSAVQLHATANIEKTSRFAAITPKPVQEALAAFSHAYAESENPFVSSMRTVTSAVGRFFDETETAKVTKWVKEMDPAFTTEAFLRDLREYIVPEMVDAYVNADQATLKAWCSEAVSWLKVACDGVHLADLSLFFFLADFQRSHRNPSGLHLAYSRQRISRARHPESRRTLPSTFYDSLSSLIPPSADLFAPANLSRTLSQIMSAKILENDLHVFVVAWRTQEVLAYRDLKTGEVVVGDENKIEQVGYVAVLTRVEEELDNKITGGWKIIDVSSKVSVVVLSSHSGTDLYFSNADGSPCRLERRLRGKERETTSSDFICAGERGSVETARTITHPTQKCIAAIPL